MGARVRRPQKTNSDSASRKKVKGVFAASPREKWKTMALTWSSA
ncbi:hypothetical protein [Corallococcus sp. AS-1-6]|nr:hypothetical protein [Corallococcus sp. AS-1-6]